jgi:hypothetical protein
MPEQFGSATAKSENKTHTVTLEIEATQNDTQIEVPWTVTSTGIEDISGRVTASQLTSPSPTLQFHLPPNAVSLSLCIATCVGGAVAGPLLDCIVKHKGHILDIIKCMKDQGFTVAAGALTCAIDCFHKHPNHGLA